MNALASQIFERTNAHWPYWAAFFGVLALAVFA